MVGLVPTIHVFSYAVRYPRRGCSPQGRAWRTGFASCSWLPGPGCGVPRN